MNIFDTCMDCEVKLKKVSVEYRGAKLEVLECPKCRQKIFTEEQTQKAISSVAGLRNSLEETGQEHQNKLRREWKKRMS